MIVSTPNRKVEITHLYEVVEEEDSPLPIIETKINNYNFFSHLIDDLLILNQKKDCVDLNIVKTHFKHLGRLSKKQVLKILTDVRDILKQEPNNITINKPSHIIGDIHGQYFDLTNITDQFNLSEDTLIFLGDYVDRGIYSTETFLYLSLLKIYYKDNIILLRGNHESRSMTSKYGFKAECEYKYDDEVYESFLETFNTLPLTAVISEIIFCVHGGLSPELRCIKDINKVNRFVDLKKDTLMRDILWSDPYNDLKIKSPEDIKTKSPEDIKTKSPEDIKTKSPENIKTKSPEDIKTFIHNEETKYAQEYFIKNKKRGYFYTYKSVCRFLNDNNLKSIIRGHEFNQEGYELHKYYNGFPSVVTIFSAPNYCDDSSNKGSLLYFDGVNISIKIFNSVEHPKLLPNNLDGINWTFPFISEKISEFYIGLLRTLQNTTEELDEILIEKEVRKATRMQLSMILVRTERENMGSGINKKSDIFINEIKMCENNKLEEVCEDIKYPKGVSMNIPNSLIPKVTMDLSKLSLNKILKTSLVLYEEKSDKGEIYLPGDAKRKENGCTGWFI